jgi:hypothetical protein
MSIVGNLDIFANSVFKYSIDKFSSLLIFFFAAMESFTGLNVRGILVSAKQFGNVI